MWEDERCRGPTAAFETRVFGPGSESGPATAD